MRKHLFFMLILLTAPPIFAGKVSIKTESSSHWNEDSMKWNPMQGYNSFFMAPQAYCVPTAGSNDATGLTYVGFNTINNPTGTTGAYNDHTGISTDVNAGDSYPLEVRVNTSGNFMVHVRAWIDWNKDETFDPASEEYSLGSVQNVLDGATSASPADIAIPADASGIYIMRLRAVYGTSAVPTPCGSQSYSEAEDYTINVIAPTADGCLDAPSGQYPSTTYTPNCLGVTENITTAGWTGEYSLVNVTAGTEYIFSSSIATDYVTISDAAGTVVYTSGVTPVTWTATTDEVVRFYLHLDEDCNSINSGLRARKVQCGTVPPPPANDDCANAIALSCGDTATGSTAFATDSGGNVAGDVFYTYTGAGAGGEITVSLCDSSFDTVVRVFSDCSLTDQIAFNDDACGTRSEVTFTSDGTSTYVIMVEGYSSNTGNYSIELSCDLVVPPAGCLDAPSGQYPSTTYTPNCVGAPENITTSGWTGEYSLVNVTAGTEYIFSSSITTDYVTISDEAGTVVYAAGTSSVTWTATADEVVRFYLHLDEDCNSINSGIRARTVQCGTVPPPPANDDCANAIALSCGGSDTGSTISSTDSGGNVSGDVFYTYTGSGTVEDVTVSLCGSSFDTVVRVFSDCSLTNQIALNDDSCGLQSEVTFTSNGTSTYIIMVEGYSSTVGNYTIAVSCEEVIPPTEYCEPTLDCTDGDVITNVTFSEINNDTDCSPNGYGDYTSMVANVVAGETYPMSVTVGNGWTFETTMVWIDFNNDFIFDPITEYFFIGSDPGTTNVADITIPAGTPDGQYRLRVRVGAINPTLVDPSIYACDEDSVFGETEDYTLNVGELGISNMNAFDFTYYPNPVKDVLNISAKKNVESVSIFNLAGQKVLNNAKVTNGQIDVHSLTSGTYVFRVTLEGGQVETFKIVKM